MNDGRIKDYWSSEIRSILEKYKQFQALIPDRKGHDGADHDGEDGRYVECLIKEYLSRYLPNNLEVLTGFVLRPAVKAGNNDKSRHKDDHMHSGQLDLIVYDSGNYPVFQRFGDHVIVPPEGVIAILSVKKHLRKSNIQSEAEALLKTAKLCKMRNRDKEWIRGPYLGLITMKSKIEQKTKSDEDIIFEELENLYTNQNKRTYDEMINGVISFTDWTIIKQRPKSENMAAYLYYEHDNDSMYLGFQHLLGGILSTYYDKTRNEKKRPGFADLSGVSYNKRLGNIHFHCIRG